MRADCGRGDLEAVEHVEERLEHLRWSTTCARPADPATAETTPSNRSGLRSSTRNDSCSWSGVIVSAMESWNCSWKRSYACSCDSEKTCWTSGWAVSVCFDLGLLFSGDLAAGASAALVELVAHEDRDLDLVVPVVLHRARLGAHQQTGAQEAHRDRDRDDDREGHRQVPAQPGADLGQDVLETHRSLRRSSVRRSPSGCSRRRRGTGRAPARRRRAR